jgi:hypothetical protein
MKVDAMLSKNQTQVRAWRIEEFAHNHGISRSQIYKEIAAGRLIARKAGARTLIIDEDADDWRRSLPKMPAKAESAAA